MKVWRNAVGTFALTLLTLIGLVPSAQAAPNFVTPFSSHGVLSGSLATGYLTRLARAFYSRGSVQDSTVYIAHNQQTFAVGRLDVYSNVQDTVKSLTITDKNTTISNIDEVQIWIDTNGNGQWDAVSDTKVATSPGGLPFVGSGSDSIALFTSFSQALVVPANSHWKTAGGSPAPTSASDSLSQADPHLSLFVVYKTAQQVSDCGVLRAAIQNGASGLVLNSVFTDTTNVVNQKFNQGAGAWLSMTVQNDSTSGVNGFGDSLYAAGTYTVINAKQLPWKQLTYVSPSLYALGQPAVNVASQNDTDVRILRIGMQSPDSCGTLVVKPQSYPAFGRTDTTATGSIGKGAQFDSLVYVTVKSENDFDGDVKTVKLWLKGRHDTVTIFPSVGAPYVGTQAGAAFPNTGDSLEAGDTLVAAVGGVPGLSAFTSGNATLVLGQGPGVGTYVTGYADCTINPALYCPMPTFGTIGGSVVANGNTRWQTSGRPIYQRNFLITYDISPVGPSHNNHRLDVQIPQFGIFFSRSGYMPSNNLAVDTALVQFRALPFTVWIDTLATDRTLLPNAVPDSSTNMHTLLVKGVIDMGDSTYNNGYSLANELAQIKIKNGSTDIDSLIVDLRAFGHSMRYKVPTNGWRPLGTDTVWSDTFAVLDPQQATFNDAWLNQFNGFSWDRYAADTHNRPTVTASNGNTGFLVSPDGPYTVATTAVINGYAFPKWYAYSHDLITNAVVIDSGWAPTGFPGDGYSGPWTMIPVDSWLPPRPTNVQFSLADSGKVDVTVPSGPLPKSVTSPYGTNPTPKNPAGGAVLVYAQSNWTTGTPSGDINWTAPVDTIPYTQYGSLHRMRDLFGTAGNPASKVIKLNEGQDYLFGFRQRDNDGNLELNRFVYSTFADTLAPSVSLVSPTRQCGIYGPDSSYVTVNDSLVEENHHLFIYAVVDSANGPDISGGSVQLHIRLKDIDPSTAGDQPGPWDPSEINVNNGIGFPLSMVQVGDSYWYTYEISALFTSYNLQDEFELTVTSTDSHGNAETPDAAYARANSLLQGALNHLCFVWDHIPPVCELTLINGQETSSGVVPIVDLATDSTTFVIRVTDAVNDKYGLPYFVRLGGSGNNRGTILPGAKPTAARPASFPSTYDDMVTIGWVYPDANHDLTVKYPTSALGGTFALPGGAGGTVYYSVQDSAGNSCEGSADFIVKDLIGPNANFVLPLNHTRLSLPYLIKVHATDNWALGVAVLTLWNHDTQAFMDTIAIVPRVGDASSVSNDYTYSYNWNKSRLYAIQVGMANGEEYDIRATVYDGNNNTTTALTTFEYDGLAPTMKLEVVDPVVVNGHTVIGNGGTVTFKATPTGPFSTDVTKVDFWYKKKSVADDWTQYTFMNQVTSQFSGAYYTSYSSFPSNDSVAVRVIAYDQSGNIAYDSDHNGYFDPGTLSSALHSDPPSAVELYTISAPDYAIWKVTDLNTGLVYYPSPKLSGEDGANVSCVYAGSNDSLLVEPSINSTNGNDTMAEYWLNGPGIGYSYFTTSNGNVLLGRSTTSPYNFSFGLGSVQGLGQYVHVYGYWQGTLTMKVYDKFGSIISTDQVCLGVTNAGANQACITSPTAGCVVWGDVDVCALVMDAASICKVRFEYKNLASGDWTPFDSVSTNLEVVKGRNQAKPKEVIQQEEQFCGTWNTIGLGLPDGEYGLRAIAIGCNGQADATPLNITVKLDNQGPAITLGNIPEWVGGGTNWTNPTTGNSLFQVLPLTATVDRSVAKVNQVYWQVRLSTNSPGSWTTLATDYTNPWAYNYIFNPANQAFWENAFGNNCDVVFRACMDDESCPPRTVCSAESTAKVDFTPPSCHFMTVNGTPVTNIPVDVTAGTNVPLVAFAADDVPTTAVNSGLDSVSFRVYGNTGLKLFDVSQAANGNTQFTTLWNTTGLTAGDYFVYFYAWDKQNNYCSSSTTVHVSDLAAPVASIGAITCTKIAAVSYDRDVNDVEIQMRAVGTTDWTNVGISTRIFKGQLNGKQAKMMGRDIAKKLHNGNVPYTLWTTTYDGSALAKGDYEFRAVARDTASNSNPSLAPIATANVGGANCTVTPVDGPAIVSISFFANETDCDSALVQVTTNGTVSIPAVVVVQQTLNQDPQNSTVDVVAMHTNSINSSTFFGSLDISNLNPGGNAWVFAGGDIGLVTDLEYNGLTIFSVTPSLGSNSTISSVDGYLSAYFPPGSVYDALHVRLLPTDMPQPQPDNNRVRGVPNPAGTIECIDVCYDYDGAKQPQAKTQGVKGQAGYSYSFAKPVKINLKYGTPVGPNTASRLSVARWNGSEWDLTFGISQVSIDPNTNTASAWISEEGCYAVVELDSTCSPGTITITDVRAIPGQEAAGAALQVPVNGYVNPRPCFSALIKDQFNNNNIENVEVWLRPVGGNNIKLFDYKTSFIHCGLDQEGNGDPGYEIGSGWMNLCYEANESEGCHDAYADDGGSDDGEFPALKQGNYILTVKATSKLGYCQTVEQEFNVDATGPTVTNLTPTYQGNNPVISWSARDDGAGISTKWQAVDLFVQEFDRDNTTIKSPIYKGTFYMGNGVSRDSVRSDGEGHTTSYFSARTHFDMKEQDHLRAVVYGGRDTDWFIDEQYYGTGPARQYLANGGVRDSLDNAAGPLEINTTIRQTGSTGTVVFTPGTGTTGSCVGQNATFSWTVAGDLDQNSLVITYKNGSTVLATRHLGDVTWTGNVVTDQPNVNLTGVTTLTVTFYATDNSEPRNTLTLSNNFTVDITPPAFGTPSFTNSIMTVGITDAGCGGIDGEDITVTVNGSSHAFTFADGILTITGLTAGDVIVVHACDGVNNCADGNFVAESGTLGFGSGSGAPHNYPNPFDNKANNTTTIVLGVTRSSSVEVRIFDLAGNLVWEKPAFNANPSSTLVWDGRDSEGREVARGVYLGQIKATDGSRTASAVIKIAVAR